MMRHLMCGALAAGALMTAGLPAAVAAPASDGQGYLDSTARCDTVDATVIFGSTDTSRIAICKTGDGYEYRGVRVRDGAKLMVPAERTGDGAFIVDSGGIQYMVTAKSLVVSEGARVIREEPMVDFHGAEAPKRETSTPTTPLPPPLPAEKGHGG